MKKIEISRFWYYIIVSLIIVVSYVNFSVLFYPFLDTNTAITVLMTPGFSIPGDLYFWGQGFYGSLVPFLAQLLNISYRFPPAMAVGVVQYLILIAGFLALTTFFKSRSSKIILCLFWFLPSWHSIAHVTSVFGLQSSFLAIGIYLINRYRTAFTQKIKLLWLSFICFTFLLSIWVSDLAFLSLIILIVFLVIGNREHDIIRRPLAAIKGKQFRLPVLTVIVWIVITIGFLWYAKSHASKTISLYHPLFSSPSELFSSIKIFIGSLFDLLVFRSGNFIESLYSWGFLIITSWIFLTSKLNKVPGDNLLKRKWFFFYGISFILMLICAIASNWVAENGTDRRYFSIIWISLWIVLLLFSELSSSPHSSLRKKLLMVLVLTGSASSLYPLYIPANVPSKNKVLSELKSLNTIGIIAEYSTAYLSSSVDPAHIKATPHDKEYIRNFNLVEDVFKQKRIYLIKEGWLTSFPDTMKQFGFLLQRTGEPFHKAGYELCRYEKIINRRVFTIGEMKYQGKIVEDTTSFSKQTAMITPEFDKGKHFIYGPFIHLPKGKYSVVFRLMASRDLSIDNVAVLDVSANFGKEVIATRTIRLCDFARSHHFEEFDIPFEVTKDYDGTEFRVMFLGGVDLSFDRVVLIEK